MKTPVPICKSFLTCRATATDPDYRDTVLIGLRSHHEHHRYPSSVTVGMFARLSSAHGEYVIEIQVQTPEGETVWKEGPPTPYELSDPLWDYDLLFNINLVFPQPGRYDLVLLANGEEIARERFNAVLTPHMAEKEERE